MRFRIIEEQGIEKQKTIVCKIATHNHCAKGFWKKDRTKNVSQNSVRNRDRWRV